MSTATKSAEPNSSIEMQLIVTHVAGVSVTAANEHNKTNTVYYNRQYSVGHKWTIFRYFIHIMTQKCDPCIKMFSFLSGITVVFYMLPYLNIVCTSSEKPY